VVVLVPQYSDTWLTNKRLAGMIMRALTIFIYFNRISAEDFRSVECRKLESRLHQGTALGLSG
jgi:hypothetical protein